MVEVRSGPFVHKCIPFGTHLLRYIRIDPAFNCHEQLLAILIETRGVKLLGNNSRLLHVANVNKSVMRPRDFSSTHPSLRASLCSSLGPRRNSARHVCYDRRYTTATDAAAARSHFGGFETRPPNFGAKFSQTMWFSFPLWAAPRAVRWLCQRRATGSHRQPPATTPQVTA